MIFSLRGDFCNRFQYLALLLAIACGSGNPSGGPGSDPANSRAVTTCTSQCGLSCVAGCYPTSTASDGSCGTLNGNVRVQCAKVQGASLTTCESGCPAGYIAAATATSPSCGAPFLNVQTVCKQIAGASLTTCEERCPSGYFPSAVQTNVEACRLRYGGIQTICTQVSGTGLDTCDDSCPSGYYPASTSFDSAGCGLPYSSIRTHCAKISGPSFLSCEACPAGYYPSRTSYPIPQCGSRYGQIQTTCVQPTTATLQACGQSCPSGYTVQGSRTNVPECQAAYLGIATLCANNATSTCEENCPPGSYVTGTLTDPACIGNIRVQCAKVQGNSFATCQQDCPSGYTATSLLENIPQCGGSFFGIQITCTRVAGNTLATCESGCPAGYHITSEEIPIPQCGNRYMNIQTSCALSTGAPFGTCGEACPDGYYPTAVNFPAFECAVRSHQLRTQCSKIGGNSFTTCGPNCPSGWFPGATTSNPACGPIYLNEETQCFKTNPNAPVIVRQPQSVSIVQGQTATLLVTAGGQGPLSFQWYAGASGDRSGPVAGATSPTLFVSPAHTTSYWVLVKNAHGETASDTATVTVAPACVAPSISAQPQPSHIASGGSATLQVGAAGTSIAYQWYQGQSGNTATPIAGATSSSATVSPSTTTIYWVKVSNACGSASSSTATVTVDPPCTAPAIVAQPQPAGIQGGQSTSLSVGATGTTLTYQWYIGASGNTGSPVPGATNSTLLVAPPSTTSYWVRVSNACGSADSGTATVTIIAPICGADGAPCGGDANHTCQGGSCVCSNCASAACCGSAGNTFCDGQQHFDSNTGYTGACASTLAGCDASSDFNGSNSVYHSGDILACVKFDGSYAWTARRPSPRCQEVAQVCDFVCSTHYAGGQGFQCDANGNWNQSPPLPGCFGGSIPAGWACQ
jgi:hypothetical protein